MAGAGHAGGAVARLGAGAAHLPQSDRGDRRAGLHGDRAVDARLRRQRRPDRRGVLDERLRQVGRRSARRVGDRRAGRAGRALVRWRCRRSSFAHDMPQAVRSLVLVNSIGGSAWQQRAHAAQHRRAAAVGLGAALPQRRVARPPGDPRAAGDGRGFRCPTWCATRARSSGSPTSPGAPTCAPSSSGCAIAVCRSRILWGTRDGIIPRESFEALCVASGVEGTVVEGSHSWLLADPAALRRGHHQRRARRAGCADLERGLDHTKQRGAQAGADPSSRGRQSTRSRHPKIAPSPSDATSVELVDQRQGVLARHAECRRAAGRP